MQQGRLSFIFLLVLLCQSGVIAVDLTTCEGDTAQLSCDLTSKVIVCESDTANLHCDEGRISVLSANYGRRSNAICSSGKPANQISNVQCTQSSSLSLVARRCDGQKDCSVPASNSVFGDPCGGTYKYLDVSYICIPSGAIKQTQISCEGGTFSINCNNMFIKVLSANYGRTNSATCSTGKPASQTSNIQCTQSSSLSVLTNLCDGVHTCSVSANNAVFGDPCGGTYKYLNMSYICYPNKQYIKVCAATYGRTDDETCSTGKTAGQISNVLCDQSSSLSVVANRCDGQKTCSVPATNVVFGDPCVGTYKYLDVSYTCGSTHSSYSAAFISPVNMQQGRLSFICLLVLLCQSGVKATDLTTCEGDTARLTCDLTSQVIACESDTASLHCGDEGRIRVLSANYGRTNSATCSSGKPANQISNVQCTQDSSLGVLASRCDGQKDCSISASNTVFGDPCGGTYKYLDVSYICIPSGAIIQRRTTCEGDTFSINCNDMFIKVLSANYGRTNSATCSTGRPANQISNVQCTQSSSLSVLTNLCDGAHTCSVSANNAVFGDPCVGTYKYLNMAYICHPNHQYIKVCAATYGRTNNETCSTGRPGGQISNVLCAPSSSLSVVATRCEGQKACSVPATNTVFGDPCVGTYKYLDLSYSCGPNPASPT
nr:uncharacterized protein LOC129430376 [Misgurnus anguillicaudatus]